MKFFLVFFALQISNSICAQQRDTTYYNANWELIENKDDASFYRVKEQTSISVSTIRDYYMSTGTIYCTGEITDEANSGRWTFYTESGDTIKDYSFINNGRNKNWYKFDENALEPNENGFYMTTNVTPRYKGGIDAFDDYIDQNFDVPKNVKKRGVYSFRVSYQLNIDENGAIVKIWDQQKGITLLNKEGEMGDLSKKSMARSKKAINKKLKKFLSDTIVWSPARVKGSPVKSAKYVSITYRAH